MNIRLSIGIVLLLLSVILLVGCSANGKGGTLNPELINKNPIIKKLNDVSEEVTEQNVTLEWEGTDADGIIKEYIINHNNATSTTTATSVTIQNLSVGFHEIFVLAVDNKGAQSNQIDWHFVSQKKRYTISVEASPIHAGYINVNNGLFQISDDILVEENEEMSLGALPKPDFLFRGWYEDGQVISVSINANMTINSTKTITALFIEDTATRVVLSSLGSEGDLSADENFYKIIDDTDFFAKWTIIVKKSKIPPELINERGYQLKIKGRLYEFKQNPFQAHLIEASIPESIVDTVEDIRNSQIRLIQ